MNTCPFCQSSRISTIWPSVHVNQCRVCGLMFRNPQPSEEELYAHYVNAYTEEKVRLDTTKEAVTTMGLAKTYAKHLLHSLGYKNFDGVAILDFGAGTGTMALVLREMGAKVIAVEPFGYHICRHFGIETYRQLEELPAQAVFDGIVSITVVEHLRQPWLTLEKLRGLLRPGGWLYLSTMNARGLKAHLTQSRWAEVLRFGHLFFFSPRSLERILKKARYKDCKRLTWLIRYPKNPAHVLLNWTLQLTRLEGDLRYLCYKRG